MRSTEQSRRKSARRSGMLRKRRSRRGLTLIELAVVMLVLGILMAVLYANIDVGGITDKAKRLAIQTNSTQLEVALERYEFENQPLEEGDALTILSEENPDNPSWRPVKEDMVMDPWKHPYFICTDDEGKKQICTNGADGQPGGEGENQDFYLTKQSSWPEWVKGKKE